MSTSNQMWFFDVHEHQIGALQQCELICHGEQGNSLRYEKCLTLCFLTKMTWHMATQLSDLTTEMLNIQDMYVYGESSRI